ncbi:MAG TPA: hypothetical protein VHS34_15660 [Terriglobales bacterium]|jgi:outer membrane protein assembly factor BamD (BamD/ComL family)|nr:hypothetical protein [Terriglobales bacterium]
MSVAGILSSSLVSLFNDNQTIQSKKQTFQQEFQQLGQDLQSGNLSAAQTDFASLQQLGPQATASAQSSSPIGQAFNQLSQDLQSGNVAGAQQDYATIQQDFQKQAAQGHHHHHGGGGGNNNAISQLLEQLGQALQSGNLANAQQAYGTLQQDFQQYAQNSGSLTATAAATQPSSSLFSVNA